MSWLVGSILSILFFSGKNALQRYISPRLPSLHALIIQAVSAIVVLLIALTLTRSFTQFSRLDSKPVIIMTVLAGIMWIFGEYFLYIVFAKNAPLTIVVPLVTGGVAIGGVLTGLLFFNESLTIVRLVGIITVLVGSIILVK